MLAQDNMSHFMVLFGIPPGCTGLATCFTVRYASYSLNEEHEVAIRRIYHTSVSSFAKMSFGPLTCVGTITQPRGPTFRESHQLHDS